MNRSTPKGVDPQVFRYLCPICGEYSIRSVVAAQVAEGAVPLEIESAALERWNNTLEVAERQRRLSKKSDERDVRHNSSEDSACA